ncbi:hypothetical protein PsYK624_156850 [Phanerochaete sordida]|uniref:Uncharacterized protein n=1 Tax=Phanerochaete sordida TaxID=48140 RepID=A0A9P3GPC1_9APHY|nr:hypothetical protein PsYK624_156850 [Phanerochaete sordida]
MAAAPAILSAEVLRDVVLLQEKEINRLKAQLMLTEGIVTSLEQQKTDLVDQCSGKRDRAAGPKIIPTMDAPVANDERMPSTDASIGMPASKLDYSLCIAPSYNDQPLHPFGKGRTARQRFNDLRGDVCSLRVTEHNIVAGVGYDTITVLRPDARLTKRGAIMPFQKRDRKHLRKNEVVVLLGEQYFYLGRYEGVGTDTLEPAEYGALQPEVQQAIYVRCGGKKHPAAVAAQMRGGAITVKRFHLRRVGFDEELNRRLLDAIAECGPSLGADGGANDDSERDDESGDD